MFRYIEEILGSSSLKKSYKIMLVRTTHLSTYFLFAFILHKALISEAITLLHVEKTLILIQKGLSVIFKFYISTQLQQ